MTDHVCNDCQGECLVCNSKRNHPAGKLRERAEKSPHDLGWALDTAKRLGAEEEQTRIIKLLTETYAGLQAVQAMAAHDGDGAELIALIKGENK